MRLNNRTLAAIAQVALLMLIPMVASAYTIVLRDGRRIEIPKEFVVGPSTLTYEAGSAIQITLQLAIIDIPSTERANKEPSGSLIGRSAKLPRIPINKVLTPGIVITNQDLERFRQARVASEASYEKRRKELGLPSAEESRQAALSIGERTQTQLLSMQSQQRESETYWRNLASALRTELSAINERVNLIHTRLNELSSYYSYGAFTTVSPFISFGQVARGSVFPGFANRHRFGQPGFGGRGGFGPGGFRGPARSNVFSRPGFGRAQVTGFGPLVALPFDIYDNSYERAALLSQLDQALIQRAGILARWRALEEEARRSGAYPGWLR